MRRDVIYCRQGMPHDYFSSLERAREEGQDPINLEISALEGAMNSFMKRGFETLDEGIPEHLYILLASFAEHVPKQDPRRRATLDLIENSFYATNENYLSRNRSLDHERLNDHQLILAELIDLVRDPWQAVDIVLQMHAVVSKEEYDRRAWEKTVKHNALNQDSSLQNKKVRVQNLKDLYIAALMQQGVLPTSADRSIKKVDPKKETFRPKNKAAKFPQQISKRLKK